MYSVPEEVPLGTMVANITAMDPDDEGFPGRLLYSITTTSSYFMVDKRESCTVASPASSYVNVEWVLQCFLLLQAFLSRFTLTCQGKGVLKAADTHQNGGLRRSVCEQLGYLSPLWEI